MFGIFLDTETNGLNYKKHRVLEIAIKLVDLEKGKTLATIDHIIKQPKEVFAKSDPSSLKVNGFTYDLLKTGITESEIAKKIEEFFSSYQINRTNAVFICQNPSFDRAFFAQLIDTDIQESLNWPYHWLDLASMYWALAIEQKKAHPWETGCSKNTIAKVYGIEEEAMPHRAINGVDHLLLCYQKLVGFPQK